MIHLQKPESSSPSSPSKQSRFTCLGCRIKFETVELQREHHKTEWHLYNLKRRVCNLPPIDLDSFGLIQASNPKKNEDEIEDKKQRQRNLSAQQSINGEDEGEEDDDDLDGDWEEIEDEELLDEDYNEEEAREMLANVIKKIVCLFCDKRSHDIHKNIEHMNAAHGFFIPEDQYLIDLEGMLEYLGFKVGAGATCLWCNKQFKSVHGVRLHMLYKDHCKILYDQEKALDEFKDFYDYSTQEIIKMKPLTELAIPKRRSERRAEYSRALAATKSSDRRNNSKQLIVRGGNMAVVAGTYQANSIKKFNSYRAKIILRTGMANNQTMRGRLRQQNPI